MTEREIPISRQYNKRSGYLAVTALKDPIRKELPPLTSNQYKAIVAEEVDPDNPPLDELNGFTLREVVEAIDLHDGTLTWVAAHLNVTRRVVYLWLERMPELQEYVDFIRGRFKKEIESEILAIAMDKTHKDQLRALEFYATHKLGWKETKNLEIDAKGTIIQFDFVRPSDD